MDKKLESKIILIFTILYLLFFTLFAIMSKNYEFLFYTIIMSSLIILIILYYKKLHLSPIILGGLSILGLMHVLGGNIQLYGTRLYDVYIFRNILRYDQLVHTFGIFIATITGYSLLRPYLDPKIEYHPIITSLILILIGLGIGAMNEIIEFYAVVFLGAEKQVGDYYNNAKDLVFNFLGSIIACYFVYGYHITQSKNRSQ